MKTIAATILACAAIAFPAPDARAAMFKCVGKDGAITYQADPCPETGNEKKLKEPAPGPAGGAAKAQSPFKEGWSAADVTAMADACVPGAIGPAKRDFQAKAKAEGSQQEFPEAELTAGVKSMCTCFARRVGATYARADFEANRQAILQKMNEEAMAGGPCKPEGALAEAMKK